VNEEAPAHWGLSLQKQTKNIIIIIIIIRYHLDLFSEGFLYQV